MNYHNKAQINSLDLIVALSIALVILVAIFVSWDRVVLSLSKTITRNDLQIIAFQVSDVLFTNTGNPENWENNPDSSKISSLGLAIEDRSIGGCVSTKPCKLNNFPDSGFLGCNKIRQLLNIEGFSFSLDIIPIPANVNNYPFTCPLSGSNQNDKVTIGRLVFIDGNVHQAKFSIWK